jgi:hypothetical protein
VTDKFVEFTNPRTNPPVSTLTTFATHRPIVAHTGRSLPAPASQRVDGRWSLRLNTKRRVA